MADTEKPGKPFLKWAGGKNWFTKYLPDLIDDLDYNIYHEPFLGGGSVYFCLHPETAILSDLNEELIATYMTVRDDVEGVIKILESRTVSEDEYYKIRASEPTDPNERAARFIYLNKTSFNGLYRVNRKGKYNVPYGKRDNYQFDFERIRSASMLLAGAELHACSFQDSLEKVKYGDLVFLDPPYTVSHDKNNFISYNKKLFSLADQHALKECVDDISSKGAYFILTNAAHPTIKDIFSSCGEAIPLNRYCGLGGKNAQRLSRSEYIFTNVPHTRLETDHD